MAKAISPRKRRTARAATKRGKDEAVIAAAELAGLTETAYLLRSPKNAERLLAALDRALNGDLAPGSIEDLRTEVGLRGRD